MLPRFALPCLLLLALVVTTWGCGTDAEARAATPSECRVVENGTTMVSPISGKTIVKQTNTPAALYDGKLYFFCCEVDRDAFLERPGSHAAEVLPPNGWVVNPDSR